MSRLKIDLHSFQLKQAKLREASRNIEERFSRKTINIAVIGGARQGKSKLLQTISGLSNEVIPAFDTSDCTGATSMIKKENKILVFIGRHTLNILALHLLAFKIVTLIYILASNGNPLLLAVFPVIKKVPFLWTAYTFCGVTVPLFLWNIIYKQKGGLIYGIHK